MLLTVSNLCVNYGAIKALQDVTLQINSGEIVTLIGSNGAGKTTLLRTISGLIRASDGTIHFDDQEITHSKPHEIVCAGICHVPEGRQVFANLSVRENLLLGAYQETSRQKI